MREKADTTISATIWPHPFIRYQPLRVMYVHMSVHILPCPVQACYVRSRVPVSAVFFCLFFCFLLLLFLSCVVLEV